MQRRRGFTLIELLVVVAIIALLVSLLLPALSGARNQTNRVRCQTNLRTIGHAIQFYFADYRDTFPYAGFYGCLGYIGRSQYQAVLGTQTPENQRPLNHYFGVECNTIDEGPQVVRKHNDLFECPADRGDAFFKLPGKYFVEHGTSYTYASDCNEPPVPTGGVRTCRNLHVQEVRFTSKKIVFQEPVFSPSIPFNDDRAHWHDVSRHHGNLLFADGHVDFMFTQIMDPNAPSDESNPYY